MNKALLLSIMFLISQSTGWAQNKTKSLSATNADPQKVFRYPTNFTCSRTIEADYPNVIFADVLPYGELIIDPTELSNSYDPPNGELIACLDKVTKGFISKRVFNLRFKAQGVDVARDLDSGALYFTQNSLDYKEFSNSMTTTLAKEVVIYDDT